MLVHAHVLLSYFLVVTCKRVSLVMAGNKSSSPLAQLYQAGPEVLRTCLHAHPSTLVHSALYLNISRAEIWEEGVDAS